jgi:hypothetical protein
MIRWQRVGWRTHRKMNKNERRAKRIRKRVGKAVRAEGLDG